MNIGMICYPTYGGSGVVATELGLALARRGHRVHFISYAMPFRLSVDYADNVFYHEVTTSSYPLFQHPLYTASLAARGAQLADSEGLDILHAHYVIPHAIAAYLSREMSSRPVKVVTTMHGTDITLVGNSKAYAPLVRFAIERCDAVTAVSDWLKRMSEESFPTDRRIDVVHNFVDTERFQRRDTDCACLRRFASDRKILLHISNFRPVKRVEDVVRVFAHVQREVPSSLIMIGDGPERDRAAQTARDLGVGEHVHFVGKQNGIENFLSLADLFVMPSDHESFGLAALEAMACETPVLGSRSGGLPEVVEDGVTGALEPVGDVEAMGRRAVEILRHPERHRAMAEAARERATRLFSIDKIIPRYEALYERTIKGE